MPDSSDESFRLKQYAPFWLIVIAVGLIIYSLTGIDWSQWGEDRTVEVKLTDLNQARLTSPGFRARQLIAQLRTEGQPYPLEELFEKANIYYKAGNLADAHLLYFFSAREGYPHAMIKMAEMSDPNLFEAGNSLFEQPDALQAYKWYRNAAQQGLVIAHERIKALQQWARQLAEAGNPDAEQWLLVIQ